MSHSSLRRLYVLCVWTHFYFYPFFMIILFIFGVLWFFFHIFVYIGVNTIIVFPSLWHSLSLELPFSSFRIFFTRPLCDCTKQSTCSFLCVCVLIEPLLFIILALVLQRVDCVYTNMNDVVERQNKASHRAVCNSAHAQHDVYSFRTLHFIYSRHTHTSPSPMKSLVFLLEMHY